MYLGRLFSYGESDSKAKENLERKLENLLTVTDSLQVSVQLKLKILALFIHSQILFELKVYNFAKTWIQQTLDSLCFRYIRRWKELLISACLKELYALPKKTKVEWGSELSKP